MSKPPGFDLELESLLAGGSLTYGFDFYHDSVDSNSLRDRGAGFAFDPASRPLADNSSYDLFGTYAQYIRPIGDRFELTAGLRYTHARAELGKLFDPATGTDISADSSWDDFSASLRATYRINDCWLAFGGISQAFRAPNLNDLSGNLTTRSGTPTFGSLNVEPEEFVTYELGIRNDTENYGMSAAIFYTDVSDIITEVPLVTGSGAEITTNGSDGYIYGIELEGYWNISPQVDAFRFRLMAGWPHADPGIPRWPGDRGILLPPPSAKRLRRPALASSFGAIVDRSSHTRIRRGRSP